MSKAVSFYKLCVFIVLLIQLCSVSDGFGQRLEPKDFLYLPKICECTWDGPYSDRFDWGIDSFKDLKGHPKYHNLYKYWRAIGPDLQHMHHYCRGLKKIHESTFNCLDQTCRERKLAQAVNEFDYVLNHSTKNFKLRAKILFEKGNLLFTIGKRFEAVKAWNGVLKLRPDLIAAYLCLSKAYISFQRKDLAIRLIKKGIKMNPNSKILKKELAKLN